MKQTIQTLYSVRKLAAQNDECEKAIEQLRGQIQGKHEQIHGTGNEINTSPGMSECIIIFVIAYIVMSILFNKILSIILCMADSGLSFTYALIYSKSNNINPIVGMVLAIPVALIIAVIIQKTIKTRVKKKNVLNSEKNTVLNEQIAKKNKNADINNRSIMEQIAVYEKKQEELVNELRSTASWYPEVYFKHSIVNYIIEQLETGKANSVNQAIVHYEAGE